MRTALLAMLLSVSLLITAQAHPEPITAALQSSVRLYTDTGQCTAFAVRPTRFVTANHCMIGIEDAALEHAAKRYNGHVVGRDEGADLIMLETELIRPGLKLGARPHWGDNVYGFGYAFDLVHPFFAMFQYMGDDPLGHAATFNRQLLPGMSGGPIVNEAGELVSVNSRSNPGWPIAGGVTYDSLQSFLSKF